MSRKPVWLAVALLLMALGAAPGSASALRLHRVARFRQPVYVTSPPGDRRDLFVVERAGRIEIVRHGRKLRRPFLDIRRLVSLPFPNNQFRDQGGLVSLAFAPDYRRSGLFYVFYTNRDGNLDVDQFQRSPHSATRASVSSRRILFALPRHGQLTDLGGDLAFGPDGYLYIGFGEGSDPDSAQNLGALTGKILRIEPTPAAPAPYSVPADNPFVGVAGARPEVFAYGLRMPWRFSFDPGSGNLIIGDVGDERFEEVDVLTAGDAGANLGWPFFEGRHRNEAGAPGGLTFPVLVRAHSRQTCAIVGGYVMRGRRIPSLRGRYVYGDVCSGLVRSVRVGPDGAHGDRPEHLTVPYLDSFGRDARGRLYAVSLLGGVYRVSG